MELTNRPLRILYLEGTGLLAADSVGRLHLLDDDLNLVRSSSVLPGASRPIYGLAATRDWIVTRDWTGHIARWSARTLDLVDYLDPAASCDATALLEGESPSLAVSRGLAIWNGRVYVNNGFMQLVVLDLESFAVQNVVPSPTGDVPIEWICTEHPAIHAISDKEGRLLLGDLGTLEFPTMVQVDSKANLHRVRYDSRHDRFWVTQDSGDGEFANVANGIVIVRPDGVVTDQLRFARDDVEFVTFSADQKLAYAGGFDGIVYIFDNSTPELKIVRTIEPFSHQLSDFVLGSDSSAYVLTQDGEIVKLDSDGRIQCRAPFRRQAVWDIQRSCEDPSALYCATDDGVAVIEVHADSRDEPVLAAVAHHVTGFGFTRRVVALPHGWAGITRDRMLFCADRDGRPRWQRDLGSLPHTLAASPDGSRLLVAMNSGAVEVDATSGGPLADFSIDNLPLWCCAYLPSGERVLATRNGICCAFGTDGRELWRLDTAEYPKRMWHEHGVLRVSGEHGVKEIAQDGSAVLRRWSDMMSNTCENGVWLGECVCAVTYAHQLLAYDETSGDLIGLVEGLPDIPKALIGIAVAGRQFVLVGGRGGYLSLYRIDTKSPSASCGVLAHVRDLYLPRPGYGRASGA